jgi:prepilin-type N-terminal cleavage/methylation domain-containing protein
MTARRSIPARRRRGMTLLELLLATTILASIMGLVAMLYGHSASWAAGNQEQSDALRLHRVLQVLSDQWATRRRIAEPNVIVLGESIDVDDERLRFLTATPILFPEWPLAWVEYRVEVDPEHRGRGGLHRRLVYRETRVVDVGEDPDHRAFGPDGRRLGEAIVLLDDCAELRWERFGPSLEELERLLALAREGEDGSSAERVRAENEETDREEEPPAWRPIETDYDYPTPAARLVGTLHEEPFTWPVLTAASR